MPETLCDRLHGIIPAPITFLHEDGRFDRDAARLYEFFVDDEGVIVGARDSSSDVAGFRRLLVRRLAGFRVLTGSELIIDSILLPGVRSIRHRSRNRFPISPRPTRGGEKHN